MMNPFELVKPLIKMMVDLILFLCKALGVLLIPFFAMLLFFFIFHYLKGKRRGKSEFDIEKPKKGLRYILKRLLIDFPEKLVLDWFASDPDAFMQYGVHIFAGEQGSGKTIAAIHFILMLLRRYPACKFYSNIEINGQDGKVTQPEDFVMKNNGEKGMIVFLDEIQNWFSSMESKDFPVEVLQDICQQRKQRKIFVGTSQIFTRVTKAIREQTSVLYLPFTVAGCLTFVRVYSIKLNSDGMLKKKTLRKMYFFVHTEELRNAYNTLERVERLVNQGFKKNTTVNVDVSTVVNGKKKK